MSEDIFQKINTEIYFDLKGNRWFSRKFPAIENFDCRNYDSSKNYFEYVKLKGHFDQEFIIFQTNEYVIISRILWLSFWLYAIYRAYVWSFAAAYLLFIILLSGYIGIIAKGQWQKKSLKISKEGCEMDNTIFLAWKDIYYFIMIPYFMDKATNNIFCVYLVSRTGILYKFSFGDFTFSSKQITKKYLPVYVEYFREKSEKR